MLAESNDSLYVACVGTKQLKDFWADVNYWQAPFASTMGAQADLTGFRVHRGFLNRAQGIPVEQLCAIAQQRGKRLLFTGGTLLASVTSCKPGIYKCSKGHSIPAEAAKLHISLHGLHNFLC